jgi:tetratricopeptide (TPR) repeat protein
MLADADPLNPKIHYELAVVYRNLDRWEDLRAAALRSLELEPMQPNAQTMVAIAERKLGNGLGFLRNYLKAVSIDPKDHELPGWVAVFLYDLDLPESADAYRSRVLAIAPSSPMALRLNLIHLRMTRDIEGARELAKQYIEDDVNNRQNAYTDAVQFLIDDGLQNGNIEEVMTFLEASVPFIEDLASNVDFKYRSSSFEAMVGWHQTLSEDELRRRADDLYAFARKVGFDVDQNPLQKVYLMLQYGNSDGLVDIVVDELFAEPLVDNLGWERNFMLPLFADLAADPRVQEEMRRYESEEAALRDEVREYLATLD